MNDDLISRSALKKAMWDESYSIATFTESGTEEARIGLTITEIEHIIDNAPTVDVGYPPYREEKCDRKKECNDYQYWHCIGCNNCKEKEEDNGE